MFQCIAVVTAALLWLLYEADWMRLRLLVGPVVTSCPWSAPATWQSVFGFNDHAYDRMWLGVPKPFEARSPVKLTRADFGYGDASRFVKRWFSPGITKPLCGWTWIERRKHPCADYRITITAWGITSTIAIVNDDPRIMRDVFKLAMTPTTEQRHALSAQRADTRRYKKTWRAGGVPAFATYC